ncbi:MAG: DUF1836 domain-containing protein [Oscillospiraceae bacterium]|jgi:hypothetical protein|nr:DUF1836 domain-containing protein [Oscillospiraceae bacterium]
MSDKQKSAQEELADWTQQVLQNQLTPWDRFPDIYLYMDQVLTFMENQLHLFKQDSNSLLTSSMINNYVKDGVLPRPEKKKYNRDHLVRLTILCLLKQVLSIPDIHILLDSLRDYKDIYGLYKYFCSAEEDAYQEICTRTDKAAADGREALVQLALQLSVEAGARRTATERILHALQDDKEKPQEPEKKDKTD